MSTSTTKSKRIVKKKEPVVEDDPSQDIEYSPPAKKKLVSKTVVTTTSVGDNKEGRHTRTRVSKNGSTSSKAKWKTMSHQGVIFPPPYEPHGVPLIYGGISIVLTPPLEEVMTMFAKQLTSSHYEKAQFAVNFMADFSELAGRGHPVQDINHCDFSLILAHLKSVAEAKKNRTKEEKEQIKAEKDLQRQQYGMAIVDGNPEPLGNYMMEPPGLFLGRGDHPKAGRIKPRILPEDVTLNLGESAPIPPCPIPGHTWGNIICNPNVAWVASWTERVTGNSKYVMFAPGATLKSQSDRKKYEKARQLQSHIESIRADYIAGMEAPELLVKQRSTVMWMLDKLALRVGNEKGNDEADTVGCCSLRVEHVTMCGNNTIELDFLGKDSMRYYKQIKVPSYVYVNIEQFKRDKRPTEELFHLLNPTLLNQHLNSLMPGLSAKVFRTYNASYTLANELAQYAGEDQLLFYNRANRKVAVLCNHQKTVSKGLGDQLTKMDDKLQKLQDGLSELQKSLAESIAQQSSEWPSVDGKPKKRDTPEKISIKLAKIQAKIEAMQSNKTDKSEGAEIQNSTSKINYMDPRITVAYCNKTDLPLKKVFAATLLKKFQWAIDEVEADPDFEW